jgi:hypothetical protein
MFSSKKMENGGGYPMGGDINAEEKGILAGVNYIIDAMLPFKDIGNDPHYRHKESCLKLSQSRLANFSGEELIEKVYSKIESNRNKLRGPSDENWRLERQTGIGERNDSSEVKLERAIVNIASAVWPDAVNWYNQIPTSSGLIDEHCDKRCAIDLVHERADGSYEFIELKVESDNPLSAAMEILKYGILYIYSRKNRKDFGPKSEGLLGAKIIHLVVLAPDHYYKDYERESGLAMLERKIDTALGTYLIKHRSEFQELRMDFRFEKFSDQSDHSDTALINILSNRTSVYLST